jgi:hypothetical protein
MLASAFDLYITNICAFSHAHVVWVAKKEEYMLCL